MHTYGQICDVWLVRHRPRLHYPCESPGHSRPFFPDGSKRFRFWHEDANFVHETFSRSRLSLHSYLLAFFLLSTLISCMFRLVCRVSSLRSPCHTLGNLVTKLECQRLTMVIFYLLLVVTTGCFWFSRIRAPLYRGQESLPLWWLPRCYCRGQLK